MGFQEDVERPMSFAAQYPLLLRKILWNRGFREDEDVEKFLNPSLSSIPSPFESLRDLDEALSLLLKARNSKDLVVIFGDYDVDGATSTVLLLSALSDWGFLVDYFIPHRVKDGYGVTLKAAQKLFAEHPSVKLVVTCDCGVASFDGIEFLRSKGVAVIVTDHHEVPPTRVSANAVINPKQKNCHYPDKKLAGVGVAFLLIVALRRALGFRDFSLSPFLDLVAIGTVCDVAELTGANRIFVRLGLKKLSETKRAGLRVMLRNLDLEERRIRARDLGFLIGPRLNASGRVGDPLLGAKALMAKTETDAIELVSLLEIQNKKRREMQEAQLLEAEEIAKQRLEFAPNLKALVIESESFHLGVVGLLAARISEAFQLPTCVLTELRDEHALADFNPVALAAEKIWKGSLRTPSGFHLANALQSMREESPELLISGGGHAMAAGVAISSLNLRTFSRDFERIIGEQKRIHVPISVDADLETSDRLPDILSLLEPFGNGNPPPLFRIRDFSLKRFQIMKEMHLKLWGSFEGSPWTVLHFRSPWVRLFEKWGRQPGLQLDFLAELAENEWNGSKSIELVLKDLLDLRLGGKRIELRENETRKSKGAREAEQYSNPHPA
jgi:single-stranded-DNA-specific exonuclease